MLILMKPQDILKRTSPLLACLSLVFLNACGGETPAKNPPAVASYTATLTERYPDFTRPSANGDLSETERTNPYHRHRLRVEDSGWYAVTSEQTFDGYLLLYKGEFSPNSLEPNKILRTNDDYPRGYNAAATPPGSSRLRFELEAGEVYSLITTFYCNGSEECGPRRGKFTNVVSPIEAPPPPFQLPEPDNEGFNITVRFLTDNLSGAQKAVFNEAAERWSALVTGDLSDVVLDGPQEFALGAPEVVGTVDDLLIDVRFATVDGPNGVLGSAGPGLVREESEQSKLLPFYGAMEFDLAEFEPGGFFENPENYRNVILHEMGHVLGIGTLWTINGLTEGIEPNPPVVGPSLPNGAYNPRFTGAQALTAYRQLLQVAGKSAEESVPIANTGGPGNYNGHWRELNFDNELMTPYATGLELLSELTAASLADLGYNVNLNSLAIDKNYALPLPTELEQLAPTPVVYTEFEAFLKFSGAQGSTTAAVENVDLYITTNDDPTDPNSRHPANSTSGCETDDFAGFTPGNIALMQRGGCLFDDKITSAVAAGASGIILLNQGDEETLARQDLFRPGATSPVPAVAVPFELGVDLADIAQMAELIMRIDTPTLAGERLSLQAKSTQTKVFPLDERLYAPTHKLNSYGKLVPLEENAPVPTPPTQPSNTDN